jgi:hypothetical protein
MRLSVWARLPEHMLKSSARDYWVVSMVEALDALGRGQPASPPTPPPTAGARNGPGTTSHLVAAFLREIAGDLLDAARALEDDAPKEALASLAHVERRVGEARQFVARQIRLQKPRGASLVILHGNRRTRQ